MSSPQKLAGYHLALMGPPLRNDVSYEHMIGVRAIGLRHEILREIEENVTKLLPASYYIVIRPADD